MSAEPMPLRPHHGLCLGFFVGYGYDDAFCANMTAVLTALQPETAVRLTLGQDVLCAFCPRRVNTCSHAAEYDRQTLTRCGLTPGRVLTWGDFRHLLETYILTPHQLSDICGNCQWFPICRGAAD